MKNNLYYTAPSDECFEDLKQAAIKLWPEIDSDHDKYGYASGKIAQIQGIPNVADNFMYIFAMFDPGNQYKVGQMIQENTRRSIKERMVAGGAGNDYQL